MICKLRKYNEEVVFMYTVKCELSVVITRSIIIINGLTFQNLKLETSHSLESYFIV